MGARIGRLADAEQVLASSETAADERPFAVSEPRAVTLKRISEKIES
ncbi:MAG: hypothetical protein ACJ758_03425 [Actinomycetota bacterium]